MSTLLGNISDGVAYSREYVGIRRLQEAANELKTTYKTTDPQTLKMIAQARGLYLPDFFRPARRPLDGSNPLN